MRLVYIITNFDTNQAYAGLTKQFTRRISNHRLKKPQLFAGNHTIFKTVPMTDAAAKRFEARAVRYLQLIGFKTINIAPPGSLGGSDLFWNKERCAAEALKYQRRTDFRRSSKSCYHAALANRWLNDVCAHMSILKRPDGYWTKARCAAEALKFHSRFEFDRNFNSAYTAAQRRGWLDEICGHMSARLGPHGYWTKQRCTEESLKYSTRTEFARGAASAYQAARRKGWLDEVCAHMVRQERPVTLR